MNDAAHARDGIATRSEFMLEAAQTAATQTLLDRTHFLLEAANFERFHKAVDEPPSANTALRDPLKRKAPREK